LQWFKTLQAVFGRYGYFQPLAGFKTTARVLGTVITFRLVLSFLLEMTHAL
jgi:hypothetical protein